MIKLLKFLKPHKIAVIATLFLLFLQTLGTLYIPTLTAQIVNQGILTGNIALILQTGGQMLLVAGLTAVVAIWGTYLSSVLSAGLGRDIRNALFTKTQHFSLNDANQIGTASLITRSTGDINQVQQAAIMSLQLLLPAPILSIGGLILAFSKDKYLSFTIVGAIVVVSVLAVLIGKKAIPLFAKLQTGMDRMNRVLRENITGVRVIRAFNRVNHEQKRLSGSFEDYASTAIRVNKIFAVMMPIIFLIMNLCIVCIVGFGGIRVSSGQMQIGDIMALIEYSMLILFYLIMGIITFMIFPRAQACANRINEVLDYPLEITDTSALPPAKRKGARLEFRNVTFRYDGAEEPVLNGISFVCHAGETTAIIGGTGSGKSTIASLIPRFYEIQEGEILIDGQDIQGLPQEELREKIGFVPQKAFLFSGTIAQNLRYGKKDADLDELRHAAKIAQADHFISKLELNYDAPVTQGGSNFSGGQKQRLSIARALVKKPLVYVFDDSFSALDFQTDAKLRAALKGEVRDAAVITVAQRISSIMDADRIIVIEDGQIAGTGNHQSLLSSCCAYQQIAKSQLSEEELAIAPASGM